MKDFDIFVKNTGNPRVGIDRTFIHGCFFVTSIIYKNTCVVRPETNDHPIFLGPILLHKDVGCDMYHYFLSHISARLSSTVNNVDVILPPVIHIGSDDQKALTKAINSVFPASKISLQETFKRQCVRLFKKKRDWCKYKRQSTLLNAYSVTMEY